MTQNDFGLLRSNKLALLTAKLNLNFKNRELLKQAFIHRSYLNEIKSEKQSNERLEFLGDSILSLVVSHHLYDIRKEDAEGELTNLRAYIVKTKSLAKAAKNLNLGNYLKLSKGEEVSGGRNNPQLLANAYEALLGAIFLDQGLEKVQQVIDDTLFKIFASELRSGPPRDAKSNLQEIVQEKMKQSPHYKILETKGPDHNKEFVVGVYIKGKEMGRGAGSSKQVAEEQSAKEALTLLLKDSS